jgi:hypothetical protein
MSEHDVGPVIVLQRTQAGMLATPRATFQSDVFRCVIAGAHHRGGEVLEMGDTRFQAAGVPWEAVKAGPEGLDELIIVGDRRGAVPAVEGDSAGWASGLSSILEDLRHRLSALVAV